MNTYFTPQALQQRVLDVPGARNLRDLGGYPTTDGRKIRWRTLFRSGHPGGIPPEERNRLKELGLRAIVDLRTVEERGEIPFDEELVGSLRYWTREYTLSRGDIVALLRSPATQPEAVHTQMVSSYRQYPKEQHDGINAVFDLLQKEQIPLLVNCTAGKDRTGIVSAILLAALGVPHEIIRRDYALTEELHPPESPLFDVDPDGPYAYLLTIDPTVWQTLMASNPAFLDAMFEALLEEYGSIETYLAAAHDIGVAELKRIRDLLLES